MQLRLWIACLWCGLLSTEATAQTEISSVEWRSPEFPPFFMDMSAGEYGIFDQLHLQVVAELPSYSHRYRRSNYPRLLYDMEQGRHLCSHALVKTSARSKYVRFSTSVLPMLPPGLVFRAGVAERLAPFIDSNDELSLRQLLQDAPLRIGYVPGRTYGAAVDRLIDSNRQNEGAAATLIPSRSSRLMINLLKANRVDAVLAYSSEAQYFTRGEGGVGLWGAETPPELQFLQLVEQPDHLEHYYGCTLDSWGSAVIDDVNHVLEQPAIRQLALDLYTRTLLPDSLPRFRDIYRRYVEEKDGKRKEGERRRRED